MPSTKKCSKPCASTKVCNPDSGRCVLITGRLGAKIVAGFSKAPVKKAAFKALTKTEIKAQLPASGSWDQMDIWGPPAPLALKMYGPAAHLLTPALAKKLVGVRAFIIWDQMWNEELTMTGRMARVFGMTIKEVGTTLNTLGFYDPNGTFSEDHLRVNIPEDPDFTHMYLDGDHYVTGSGADPIFVFVAP